MAEWSVLVETGVAAPLTIDQIEALTERLERHSGIVSASRDMRAVGAQMTVNADDAHKATGAAIRSLTRALTHIGAQATDVDHVNITTRARFLQELEQPTFPELVGASEIGAILNVTRQRVHQLTSRPDFPQPVARLAAGPVWTRPSIQRFIDTWTRKTGRPATSGHDTGAAAAARAG